MKKPVSGSFLLVPVVKLKSFLEEYGKKFFIFTSIGMVATGIVVRIIMYAKNRSLWVDETALAMSIVSGNWLELLTPPLSNGQSAPVLYVLTVKAISSALGYSEFSLRIFSFFAFAGFLVCMAILLKKAFNLNIYKIAFAVIVCALLPTYIWYSNELKPYMSDALFVILTILLYFYYTQEKIKLLPLTVLYILILGFSSPAIFFIGGTLLYEFIAAVSGKNRKRILSVSASGAIIVIVFAAYYFCWMAPVAEKMGRYWSEVREHRGTIKQILNIFSGPANSKSHFVWFFVPFSLLGIYSSIKSRNKIAYSVALSLLLTFFASSIGKWPLTGRLWLFLPAIVLVFTPIGFEFIADKTKYKKLAGKTGFVIFFIITVCLLINSLMYTGDKMFFTRQEINPLIRYIQENIKDSEKLYVYSPAREAFEFKNGYNVTKIGNVTKDTIIFGENRDEWNEKSLGNELRLILENEKTYLLFQHHRTGIDNGLTVLRDYGTLTEIMNAHNTPLYYFERNNISPYIYKE